LAKRAAIMLLDGASSSNQRLVQAMALDDTEEPGVRAKAILKMAEARTPEVEAALKDLLERFAENDLVPLAAVVDGIMREPSPANLSLVRDKIQNMADPQVKKILLSRVEIGTGKETP